jgi:hypothetical protein
MIGPAKWCFRRPFLWNWPWPIRTKSTQLGLDKDRMSCNRSSGFTISLGFITR